ncbi:MAG TPA: metallophosphoesterase, partial [Blastocatellia bacterium]|nr:metallophosphoesterase [Blastocatellia bacterium]
LPRNAEAGGMASGTEDYYSYDYGNIHFVCLDSMTNEIKPDSPMLKWLTSDLAANTKQWLIAYWHHPPYTKGSHDSDAEYVEIAMREHVLPILEAYGVDMVLTGHSHSYERSYLIDGHYGYSGTFSGHHKKNGGSGRPNEGGAYTKPTLGPSAHEGAVYVVAGSSGQATGGALNHPAMFISLNNLGSMVLDINGNRLDAKFLRETGAIADSFTIIKGNNPSPSLAQAANTSAASYVRNHIAVEGLVSAFGLNLSSTAKAASSLPLPTTLNGTTVKVRDAAGQERPAPLLFVSPGQVNYQIPSGTVAGAATITITNADVPVATETITVAATAPGIFTADASGKGWAAASIQRIRNGVSTYEQVVEFDAKLNQHVARPIELGNANEQVYLLLYSTGVRHRGTLREVKATVEGVEVPVEYAGAQGQFVGLDQLNIPLPQTLRGKGEVTITIVVNNRNSNQVKLKIK